MELNDILNNGIKNITSTAKRFYSKSIKGNAFMLKTLAKMKKSAKVRERYEQSGTHIPPFLIASVTSSCNLTCQGCYSSAFRCENKGELGAADWNRIFSQAEDIGVSFILLAGGEPLLKREIIESAAKYDMVFPVFTNATLINEQYLELFDKNRNLISVLSIEGANSDTDERRGKGVAEKIERVKAEFKKRNILYGVSITVTNVTKDAVTDYSFVRALREAGCGLVFYVEYVPAQSGTENLVLSESELSVLQGRINALRKNSEFEDLIMLSFPGDEKALGGCLAAGRGFFHINPNGGAEPCPFSPYSKINLKEHSLLDALNSTFFEDIQKLNANTPHTGGCSLFNQSSGVSKLLNK